MPRTKKAAVQPQAGESDVAELANLLKPFRTDGGGFYSLDPPEIDYEPDFPADRLRAALKAPPDPADAEAVAMALIGSFPGTRVSALAYATGLSAIVTDDAIPPAVVRLVCRRVRAKERALPVLADLRAEMVKEAEGLRRFLRAVESYADRYAAREERDLAEAKKIAEEALVGGCVDLDPADILEIRHYLAPGWLVNRHRNPPRLRREWQAHLIEATKGGHGTDTAALAAEMIKNIAALEREGCLLPYEAFPDDTERFCNLLGLTENGRWWAP
jgi:hypothetical protein